MIPHAQRDVAGNRFSPRSYSSRRGICSRFAPLFPGGSGGLAPLCFWRIRRVGGRRAGDAATLLAYGEGDLLCRFLRHVGGAVGRFGIPGLRVLDGVRGRGIGEREGSLEMTFVDFGPRGGFVVGGGSLEELTHSCWGAV
jgi:hypothetical protein